MLNVFRSEFSGSFPAEFGCAGGPGADRPRGGPDARGSLAPLFGLLMAVGVAASVAQVGFQVNSEKLEPNFDKLNPATGWTKLISMSALVRGGLALLRVAALVGMAYWVIERRGGVVTTISRDSIGRATSAAWAVVIRLATYLSAAVVFYRGG